MKRKTAVRIVAIAIAAVLALSLLLPPMAAYRAGIKTVVIPKDNEVDLQDIEPVVRETLRFVPAAHMDTVMETAIDFARRPKKGRKSPRSTVARRNDTTATAVVQ